MGPLQSELGENLTRPILPMLPLARFESDLRKGLGGGTVCSFALPVNADKFVGSVLI